LCGRRDSNSHGITRQILSLVRLPFRHFRGNSLAKYHKAGNDLLLGQSCAVREGKVRGGKDDGSVGTVKTGDEDL
jgi:hypothetical protein